MGLNSKIFDYLDDDENLIFEQEPLRSIVKDDELMMFKHDGFWQPMDTSREYQLLNSLFNSGNAPWMKWIIKRFYPHIKEKKYS